MSRVTWMMIGLVAELVCGLSCKSFATEVEIRVLDAAQGQPLACRIHLTDEQGNSFFVATSDPAGSALPYTEQWVPMPHAVERHTTISAHPCIAELPAGRYTLEIERGKEYRVWQKTFEVAQTPLQIEARLERWVDMASRGWWSGETHVHRRIHELSNVMLAEELNVAFPVTYWTIRSDQVPNRSPSPLRSQGPSPWGDREDRGAEPIEIDATHVIVPRNTEYEIFSVGDRRHTLGAIFVLNHRRVFEETAPPIAPIARLAHEQGALLDLDKHSWPWSLMLVPIAQIDLYELSNNSVWRTEFGFNQIPGPLPTWSQIEQESETALTEWGWLQYGFEIYYALLNCGFKIAPTAGTASGVHPVPLGYSRVYVQIDGPFSLDQWLDGLKQGRSFVTTGPMLFAKVQGTHAGTHLEYDQAENIEVSVEALCERRFEAIEILVNGDVVRRWLPEDLASLDDQPRGQGQDDDLPQAKHRESNESISRSPTSVGWVGSAQIPIEQTSWIAVRLIEQLPNGRRRFAHTAPWYVSIDHQPQVPRLKQVEYFIGLMERELERNRELLDAESLAEFQQALEHYRGLLPRVR